MPGCGKTTYLKPLAAKLGLSYICPDDIREEITGEAKDHTQETKVWKIVHDRIKSALKSRGVVIDATYTKVKDRRELIQLCKALGATEIIAYWFNLPLEVCLKRNANRARKVPDSVIEKMYNRLQLNHPLLKEGLAEIVEIKK